MEGCAAGGGGGGGGGKTWLGEVHACGLKTMLWSGLLVWVAEECRVSAVVVVSRQMLVMTVLLARFCGCVSAAIVVVVEVFSRYRCL